MIKLQISKEREKGEGSRFSSELASTLREPRIAGGEGICKQSAGKWGQGTKLKHERESDPRTEREQARRSSQQDSVFYIYLVFIICQKPF